MPIVTRFPPSPTGYLHVGGARTALFNWLHAKKNGGEMVLRIEDTDRARSTQAAIDVILEALQWLGLDWQRGPFYQSQRVDLHRQTIQRLVDENHAYYCFCEPQKLDVQRQTQRQMGQKPRYDGHCRALGRIPNRGQAAAVRFKNPLTGTVVFDDLVRGKISIANAELDDLIIARRDGSPTYHLGVVADDIDMGITHVMRGDDHLNNTPRQINIFRALGATPPVFAHVPLILGADGQRLSKRHGAVSVLDYRDMGILPEALLNYLARLGWSHGDQEIFSLEEMVRLFDVADINAAAASFDVAKLLWLNQIYIQQATSERLVHELGARLAARDLNPAHGPALAEVVEAMRSRARTLEEMADKVGYLYAAFDDYEAAAARKHLRPAAADLLTAAHAELSALTTWDEAEISAAMERVLAAHSVALGKLAQPLRVAISGAAATPPIEVTLRLVGRRRSLRRIEQARHWCIAAK